MTKFLISTHAHSLKCECLCEIIVLYVYVCSEINIILEGIVYLLDSSLKIPRILCRIAQRRTSASDSFPLAVLHNERRYI